MPSNIFANTGTNVSILFLDKDVHDSVILIDASKLGEKKKVDGLQRTFLSTDEQEKIEYLFAEGKKFEEEISSQLKNLRFW